MCSTVPMLPSSFLLEKAPLGRHIDKASPTFPRFPVEASSELSYALVTSKTQNRTRMRYNTGFHDLSAVFSKHPTTQNIKQKPFVMLYKFRVSKKNHPPCFSKTRRKNSKATFRSRQRPMTTFSF